MNRVLPAAMLFATWLATGPVFADVPAALAPYITADEYRAAGLHRLTPAERARFERWFLRTVGAEQADADTPAPAVVEPPAPAAVVEAPPAVATGVDLDAERRQLAEERRQLDEERRRLAEEAERADVENPRLFGFGSLAGSTPAIEAHINGTFTGWRPGARIALDNGQVWEVTGSDGFRPVRPLENPAVTITRRAFGSFLLRVEGYNASTRVRRIE